MPAASPDQIIVLSLPVDLEDDAVWVCIDIFFKFNDFLITTTDRSVMKAKVSRQSRTRMDAVSYLDQRAQIQPTDLLVFG